VVGGTLIGLAAAGEFSSKSATSTP
jgi:hypothetical protein